MTVCTCCLHKTSIHFVTHLATLHLEILDFISPLICHVTIYKEGVWSPHQLEGKASFLVKGWAVQLVPRWLPRWSSQPTSSNLKCHQRPGEVGDEVWSFQMQCSHVSCKIDFQYLFQFINSILHFFWMNNLHQNVKFFLAWSVCLVVS